MEPAGEQTDAALVAGVKKGNSAAFEALVRRYYRIAFATALSLVGNSMDAEDVCQDAFVRVLDRLEDCRSPDRFKAWFLKIVRNRAHNYRDYQQVRAGPDVDEMPVAGGSDPGRDAARSELRSQMEAALAKLTDMQRDVVLLHDMQGTQTPRDRGLIGRVVGKFTTASFCRAQTVTKIIGG